MKIIDYQITSHNKQVFSLWERVVAFFQRKKLTPKYWYVVSFLTSTPVPIGATVNISGTNFMIGSSKANGLEMYHNRAYSQVGDFVMVETATELTILTTPWAEARR